MDETVITPPALNGKMPEIITRIPSSSSTHNYMEELFMQHVITMGDGIGWAFRNWDTGVEKLDIDGLAAGAKHRILGYSSSNDLSEEAVLSFGDGRWLAYMTLARRRHIRVFAVGKPPFTDLNIVLDLFKKAFPVEERLEDKISVNFWGMTQNGPQNFRRKLRMPHWPDLVDNYPTDVADRLGPLMNLKPVADAGKLILWHGDPGTGKSFALRAMTQSWREWCNVSYVIDPEDLLTSSSYLMSILGAGNGFLDQDDLLDEDFGASPASTANRWQLLVLEDADEFITMDAKSRTGQALSRLLNLSDGLLGQGLGLIILITTNEPLGKLHPAVIRPGRCLSEIEFTRLTAEESDKWLASQGHEPLGRPFSLAELYGILAGGVTPKVAESHLGLIGGGSRR